MSDSTIAAPPSAPAVAAPDAREASNVRDARARLTKLAEAQSGRLRLAAACQIGAGWLLLPQAGLIAYGLQQVFVEGAAVVSLHGLPWALAAVLALRALLSWGGRELADTAASRIQTGLRQRLAERLLAAGAPWLRRQRSGALGELTGTHVDALHGYYAGFVPTRLEVLWVPLAILVAAFIADWVVGLILLLTLPLIPLFMMLVGWSAEAASRRQLQALARLGGHFADRLRGLGLIRAYGRGEAELQGIGEAAEDLRQRAMKVLRLAFLSSAVLEFFASVSVALIAVYLGFTYLGMLGIRQAPLTLATGMFCLLLAPDFYAPLRRLAAHYHDRAAALAAIDEIEAALAGSDAQATTSRHADAAAGSPAPRLLARGLAIGHHGRDAAVLQGIDFDIRPGEFIAIAGPSGSGKTTLLETVAGWLPPLAGELQVEPAVRIGYAPQRPFLFHGSIADNLRLARPDAGMDELQAAAEATQAMEFIRRLPAGMDTLIGEHGFGLSGGEARRLALARLLLRDAPLWLLDEPSAFLDADTEAALLRALRRLAHGRTVLMATHSPAALAAADRVLHLATPAEAPR
ncbi:thiol reductant ABC exporter subunit CydD [Luteimonas sp. e5]